MMLDDTTNTDAIHYCIHTTYYVPVCQSTAYAHAHLRQSKTKRHKFYGWLV